MPVPPTSDRTEERSALVYPVIVWVIWRVSHACALLVFGGNLADDAFQFDGAWFLSVLHDGYSITDPSFRTEQNPAFFPGLVWLTEPFSWAMGERPAALFVANVTGLAAFVAVFAGLRVAINDRAARRGVIGLALWPASVVLTAFYSEGLLLSATGVAIWADRSRHPAWAATSAVVAALTRSVGAAIGPAVAIARVVRDRRVDRTTVLYAVSGPAGLALVSWSQHVQTGDAAAWLRAQRAWGRGLAGPWRPVWRAAEGILEKLPKPALELGINLTAMVLVGLSLVVITRQLRRDGTVWPMLAWGWAAWLIPLFTSLPSSQVRFALAAWPALLVVDHDAGRRRTRWARTVAAMLCVVVSVILVRRWAHGAFIG